MSEFTENVLLEVSIVQVPELKMHKRTIYGPLDLLGDVGGLADALIAIGGAVIASLQILSGNRLTNYLIQSVFETDS